MNETLARNIAESKKKGIKLEHFLFMYGKYEYALNDKFVENIIEENFKETKLNKFIRGCVFPNNNLKKKTIKLYKETKEIIDFWNTI